LDATAAAGHAITVATATMMGRALPFLARLGVDPQQLTLVLFGGAGAIHGPLLAAEIGINEILIPPTPSVFCAAGCLVASAVHDAVRAVRGQVDLDGVFAELKAEVDGWLDAQMDGALLLDRRIERHAAMRYVGQSFSIDVRLPDAADRAAAEAVFHREHLRVYAHADPASPVEFVELRMRIIGDLPRPAAGGEAVHSTTASPFGTRVLVLDGVRHAEVPVYLRGGLAAGKPVTGPAIIEQADTAVLVPAGFRAEAGHAGELRLSREV